MRFKKKPNFRSTKFDILRTVYTKLQFCHHLLTVSLVWIKKKDSEECWKPVDTDIHRLVWIKKEDILRNDGNLYTDPVFCPTIDFNGCILTNILQNITNNTYS